MVLRSGPDLQPANDRVDGDLDYDSAGHALSITRSRTTTCHLRGQTPEVTGWSALVSPSELVDLSAITLGWPP